MRAKIKIIDIHTNIYRKGLRKNFYLKDKSKSFETLKGTWVWSNDTDSLIVESLPVYRKPYESPNKNTKNAYYDSGVLNIKYIKDGKLIFDNTNKGIVESCLVTSPFKVQTNVFYLNNHCKGDSGSYLILRGDFQQLFLVSPYTEKEKVLLEKEGEYKVVIPHSIVLDKVDL